MLATWTWTMAKGPCLHTCQSRDSGGQAHSRRARRGRKQRTHAKRSSCSKISLLHNSRCGKDSCQVCCLKEGSDDHIILGGGVSEEMPTSISCERALVKFLQVDVLNLALRLSKSKTWGGVYRGRGTAASAQLVTYPLATFHTAVYEKLNNTGDCHCLIYFPVTSVIVFNLIVHIQVVGVCDSARKLKNLFSAFCCLFLTSVLFINDKSYTIWSLFSYL